MWLTIKIGARAINTSIFNSSHNIRFLNSITLNNQRKETKLWQPQTIPQIQNPILKQMELWEVHTELSFLFLLWRSLVKNRKKQHRQLSLPPNLFLVKKNRGIRIHRQVLVTLPLPPNLIILLPTLTDEDSSKLLIYGRKFCLLKHEYLYFFFIISYYVYFYYIVIM